ncbi:redox-regulated ATPase YchF [Candidatus Woesearchaeota archaeon]|nr:MAG: redox-regulated ATPase YchF [Candidatus Woesearchaeota archaeon]
MLIGVVGKANVGKSTFFKALTLADVEIANYPFATIKPNTGVGFVEVECAGKFFGKQCNPREGFCIDQRRFVPVQLIDVAGLVPGAHEGKGMGNQFLSDLNQADALIHVIDVSGSTNEKGEPVTPGSYDPARDIKFLEDELDYWYLGILKKGWEKFARQVQQEHQDIAKALAKQLSGLGVDEDMTKETISLLELNKEQPSEWSEEDLMGIARSLRKKTKPMIIAANKIDVPGAWENYERVANEFNDYLVVACSAESELALKEAAKKGLIDYVPGSGTFEIRENAEMNEQQRKGLDFIREKILDRYGSTGVQQVMNKLVFNVLGYIAVFPGGVNKLEDSNGNVLPDCFLLKKGSTALDFAYKLHTDFGKNFIRAIDVKEKMTVGKDHILKNGDVIEIVADK